MLLNTMKFFAGNIAIKKKFGEDNFSYAWELLPIVLKSIDKKIS